MPDQNSPKLLDIIRERSDLSTLFMLLKITGLDDLLRTDGSFTVFAPNNKAFADDYWLMNDFNQALETLSQTMDQIRHVLSPEGDTLVKRTSAALPSQVYTVVTGDTLSTIARQYNTTVEAIFQANQDKITDPSQIYPDQQLVIPGTVDEPTKLPPPDYLPYNLLVNKLSYDAHKLLFATEPLEDRVALWIAPFEVVVETIQGKNNIQTLTGMLTLDRLEDGTVELNTNYINEFIEKDIRAANGVLHIVSTTLTAGDREPDIAYDSPVISQMRGPRPSDQPYGGGKIYSPRRGWRW